MSDKKKLIGIYGFVIVVYFVMAMLTPLIHDDQMWALDYGTDMLANWFDDYNGRYFGNILVMLITRSFIIKVIVFTIVNSGIVILISELVKGKKYQSMVALFSFMVMLLIPVDTYKQTYAWTAGFANYNVSIFLTLLILFILKKINDTAKEGSWLWNILIVILAFSTQLFVEHITLYAIILAIFLIVLAKIRTGKTSKLSVSFLIGTIVGGILMFSNSAYGNIFSGSDTVNYREVSMGSQLFIQAWEVYRREMYRLLVLNNLMLNLILSILVIVYLLKKQDISRQLSLFRTVIIFYLTTYALYGLIIKNQMRFTLEGHESGLGLIESLLTIVYLLAICASFLFFEKNKSLKLEFIFYGVSAVLVAAPLVVVTPIGPRCFLASYVFFALLAGKLFITILNETEESTVRKLTVPLISVVLLMVSIYGLIFVRITLANNYRLAYIQEKVNEGATSITVENLPHEPFLHSANPEKGSFHEKVFKEYYHIPMKTKLNFVDRR